ncbi:hypothetical protein Hanom_Chr05g00443011 [Helianthus anomalus]
MSKVGTEKVPSLVNSVPGNWPFWAATSCHYWARELQFYPCFQINSLHRKRHKFSR